MGNGKMLELEKNEADGPLKKQKVSKQILCKDSIYDQTLL